MSDHPLIQNQFLLLLALTLIWGCPTLAENSVVKTVLASALEEPIALDVAANGRVLIAGRRGQILSWYPQGSRLETNAVLSVFSGPEDGILGLALHPGFITNGWFFLYHSTPGILQNHLSRFTLTSNGVSLVSQKILLRVPTQIPKPNHSGGGLGFDGDGNLYLSTGDYTYAHQSDGYAPLDRRPGKELNDSERTAANTFDLRGKILRIHPEGDGSYTLPAGNLFSIGTPKTLPEIYIMGCRNPFRFSVDRQTGWLWWGDVGPDARVASSERGPAGFDEFNRTRSAGNFGWPYFNADNRAYSLHNFETGSNAPPSNPERPENTSPNNTGLRTLPPTRPATLWYPPGLSTRWPQLGSGPRSAMAGPIYHFDPTLKSSRKLPSYFDAAVFLFDWERGWIIALWMDSSEQPSRLEPVIPVVHFKRPICLQMGPDGALYGLEWGSNWANNKDAALFRIETFP